MLRAVTTAQNVKDAPAKAMLDLAQRYLSREAVVETAAPASPEAAPKAKSAGCCGPSTKSEEPAPKAAGCCDPASKSESSAEKKSGCC
jgi:hypothetical protein